MNKRFQWDTGDKDKDGKPVMASGEVLQFLMVGGLLQAVMLLPDGGVRLQATHNIQLIK